MQQRRSGRIAKEIPILLLGTDTAGTVFSEATKTVVLSRHGAGILSAHRFTPDDTLTLRLPATNKEAEVRLAGQIGGEHGRYVYGVAFVDPDSQFWPMEFPPPEPFESAGRRVTFGCTICHQRQEFEPGDIDEDVYSVNGHLLRFCKGCGTSTPWEKAGGKSDPIAEASASGAASDTTCALTAASSACAVSTEAAPPAATAVLTITETTAPSLDTLSPSPTQMTASVPDTVARRLNRRRHMRIGVNFSACVRRPAYTDEIVQCQNVSKGGLCFQSHSQYPVGATIEIAAPYSPGELALFVPARITRVEPVADGQAFRCGVEYTKPASQSPSP